MVRQITEWAYLAATILTDAHRQIRSCTVYCCTNWQGHDTIYIGVRLGIIMVIQTIPTYLVAVLCVRHCYKNEPQNADVRVFLKSFPKHGASEYVPT